MEPKEEDEGEGEATGDDVPRPNSSDFEDDDGEGDDDDELPNESGDDDSDLFKGRFAAAPKSTEQTLEEMLGSLPPKLAGLKESFDGKLLESLPKSLSESLVCTPYNTEVVLAMAAIYVRNITSGGSGRISRTGFGFW